MQNLLLTANRLAEKTVLEMICNVSSSTLNSYYSYAYLYATYAKTEYV